MNSSEDQMTQLNTFLNALSDNKQRNRNVSYFRTVAKNLSLQFIDLADNPQVSTREVIVIACYTLIVVVSVFGNLLVCSVVARNRVLRSTTYVFIANLAVSDLLMTVLNIPFNVARILLNKWPFGAFMCSFVPLVQVTSVYVSTFTMMCIALDRYQVITKPLKPRLRSLQATVIMATMWILSIILSLPHAIFNEVVEVFTYRTLVRCRATYPFPKIPLRMWITLVTFLTQYVAPLSITGVVYGRIMLRVWSRDILGAVTEAQLVSQVKAKWKTIKMLIVVVILFALCWLPLNLYHVVMDSVESTNHPAMVARNSTAFFLCHWLAMSSVCYNPFIYCWLNDNFRAAACVWFNCFYNFCVKLRASIHPTCIQHPLYPSSSCHHESVCHHHSDSTRTATSSCRSNQSSHGALSRIRRGSRYRYYYCIHRQRLSFPMVSRPSLPGVAARCYCSVMWPCAEAQLRISSRSLSLPDLKSETADPRFHLKRAISWKT